MNQSTEASSTDRPNRGMISQSVDVNMPAKLDREMRLHVNEGHVEESV